MPVQNAFIDIVDYKKKKKSPIAIYTTAEASLPPYEVTTTQEVAAVFYNKNSSYKLPTFVS